MTIAGTPTALLPRWVGTNVVRLTVRSRSDEGDRQVSQWPGDPEELMN